MNKYIKSPHSNPFPTAVVIAEVAAVILSFLEHTLQCQAPQLAPWLHQS